MFTKRNILQGIGLATLGTTARALVVGVSPRLPERLRELEHFHGGKLGVAILDAASGRIVSHRGDDRFPTCSVAKLPATMFVLARVDRGDEQLDRRVRYTKDELVSYSPATEKSVSSGMTMAEVCRAAITLSDNTAYNLILDSFGGPAALTTFLRSTGDQVTRADRRETELNDVVLGDVRDTTTPTAMASLTRHALAGDLLSAHTRVRLVPWLKEANTGPNRLRAATPAGWLAGNKTGTGPRNATNDVAIFYPPRRAPIIIAAFYIDSPQRLEKREAVLANVAEAALSL